MLELLKTSLEENLHTKVLDITRITQGEVTQVYKVITPDGPVIARVFRSLKYPEDKKLQWIEEQLAKQKIEHPKILFYSRKQTYFPYGFMVAEFVDGESCRDAILKGEITFSEFHEQLAELLNRIHKIKVSHFGALLASGGDTYSNFERLASGRTQKALMRLQGSSADYLMLEEAKLYVLKYAAKYNSRITSCLVHGDAIPANSIYTPKGSIVLIDWDGAAADTWVHDYACLTYSGSYMDEIGSLDTRRRQIREAFERKYTNQDFSSKELRELEKVLQILQILDNLAYYYDDKKDRTAFDQKHIMLKNILEYR